VRNFSILDGIELDKREVFIEGSTRRVSTVEKHHGIIDVVVCG
jgi:hypothetical protein